MLALLAWAIPVGAVLSGGFFGFGMHLTGAAVSVASFLVVGVIAYKASPQIDSVLERFVAAYRECIETQ